MFSQRNISTFFFVDVCNERGLEVRCGIEHIVSRYYVSRNLERPIIVNGKKVREFV